MTRTLSRIARVGLPLTTCCALATPAWATSLSVPGTANIFSAGHSGAAATPEPEGQGGGSAAPFIALNGVPLW